MRRPTSRRTSIVERRPRQLDYDAGWRPPETPLLGRDDGEDLDAVLREAGYGHQRFGDED